MKIERFYRDILGFRDEEIIRELSEASKLVLYDKGKLLIRQGERQDTLSFIIDGVLRGFYINSEGKEITDQFGFKAGQPAMASFELGEYAVVSIETVTEGKLIEISISHLIEILQKYREGMIVYNKLLREALGTHLSIKVMLQQNGAVERYKWFLDNYPGLIDIVKHKDIASFLGITPVNLSRIRKKIKYDKLDV